MRLAEALALEHWWWSLLRRGPELEFKEDAVRIDVHWQSFVRFGIGIARGAAGQS